MAKAIIMIIRFVTPALRLGLLVLLLSTPALAMKDLL